MSKENMNYAMENESYAAWEKTFVENTRNILDEQGYPYSGIMMNWVKKDGRRTYTVAVHHRRISNLAKEEQEQLLQMILREKSGGGDCDLLIVFQD